MPQNDKTIPLPPEPVMYPNAEWCDAYARWHARFGPANLARMQAVEDRRASAMDAPAVSPSVQEGTGELFPVTFEWTWSLPMQQQSVLLLAARGPDGVAKNHPCKDIVRAYRACVFKAAYFGRALAYGEKADTFMAMDMIADSSLWTKAAKFFFDHVDELPHHYLLHLLHGAQILGYGHPDEQVRSAWDWFYRKGCDDMHLTPETAEEMNERLSDWHRKHWDAATPTPDRQGAESEQPVSFPYKVAVEATAYDADVTSEGLAQLREQAAAYLPGMAPTAPASGGSAVAVEEVERRDEKLFWFLFILHKVGKKAEASDYPWEWTGAFCNDREKGSDTFNLAIEQGLAGSSHDSDSDAGTVFLTKAGEEWLTRVNYLAIPPTGWLRS